jgi:hypothetical protein
MTFKSIVLSTSVMALLATSAVAQTPTPSIDDIFPNILDTSKFSNIILNK